MDGPVKKGKKKDPVIASQPYEQLLARAGIYMRQPEPRLRLPEAGTSLCRKLVDSKQAIPRGSLFNGNAYESVCEAIASENEARVIQDIARLVVPSPSQLYHLGGASHLRHLKETVDKKWSRCSPAIGGTQPRPDFSVGLDATCFTSEQLRKLGSSMTSPLRVTEDMYFPFLVCEVKCATGNLECAERQNALSTSIAAKTVVQLYQAISRQDELDRQVLCFSVSHDHRLATIYAHYAVMDGTDTSFYRRRIRNTLLTEGRDRWTAYKFTRNVYDHFAPIHLRRILDAVDQLPDQKVCTDSISQQS